ncbi:putative nucleoside-diphosphate-sugar epimerase protein [Botryosphaeria dothidea]|uniref:Nucleoside-diphosphate-sugar epimerase protein n=1 Tax=Botryosphaeria dothidea TaxID=55169 RepID=A0A8H4J231_9PEZI|nr:putative nucleoside-diphosphate-sugar epimerase protein [Botryosphaeria dothidea]
MHLILTGATGLIGSIVLATMLDDPAVTKISIISRKPVPQADGRAKAEVIIQEDVAKYDAATLAKLKGAHGCVWALGPPLMSVTRDEYEHAHIELPALAAKIYSTLSDNFNFVYVSHDGIDEPGSRRMPAYDVKFRAEERLLKLSEETPSLSFFSVRPALIDYSYHTAVHPYIKYPLPLPKKISNWVLIPVFRFFGSVNVTRSEDLGTVLTELAYGDGADLTVEGASHGGRYIGVVGMANYMKDKRPKEGVGAQ